MKKRRKINMPGGAVEFVKFYGQFCLKAQIKKYLTFAYPLLESRAFH